MMGPNKKKQFREKMLISLQAFLPEDQEIIKIINLCHLQPMDGWRLWENSESYALHIQNNKKIVARFKKYVSQQNNDIYAFAPASDLIQMSQKILLVEEENYLTCLFWGNDDRFRCRGFNIKFCQWMPKENVLSIPLSVLRSFVKNDITQLIQFEAPKRKKNFVWASPLPLNATLIQAFRKDHQCNPSLETLFQEFSST